VFVVKANSLSKGIALYVKMFLEPVVYYENTVLAPEIGEIIVVATCFKNT
jgi:hypothetical protein